MIIILYVCVCVYVNDVSIYVDIQPGALCVYGGVGVIRVYMFDLGLNNVLYELVLLKRFEKQDLRLVVVFKWTSMTHNIMLAVEPSSLKQTLLAVSI